MFPSTYFAARFFAVRYWPPVAGAIVAIAENFQGFIANVGRLGKR